MDSFLNAVGIQRVLHRDLCKRFQRNFAQRGNFLRHIAHVRRLISVAADGFGRKVRAVCLNQDAVKRHIRLSMELVMCMVCAMAFGLAAVAVNFAPLFYGDDFAYSGTLMIPLSFTLLSIGFANVIRTQWVLPQGRDTIFVHSVLTGAVINLIANFVLIPPFGAMGAAAATVLAEFSVPAVQFVYLRKELPYAQYLKTTGVYCLFGLVMAGVVALLGYVLPLHGWGKLAVQVIGGAAVYGALCLTYWKLAKRSDIFRLMRRK